MAFYSLQPAQVDWRGGTLLQLRYPWAGPPPYSAHLALGDDIDLICYSAEPGQGTALTPAGQLLRLVSPPLPAGRVGAGTLWVFDASGAQLLSCPLPCLAPNYLTSTYALRRLLPSTWAVGPRSLAEEVLT